MFLSDKLVKKIISLITKNQLIEVLEVDMMKSMNRIKLQCI